MPGSTADTEVAAQIAARTQASAQRRQDFTAALLAQVGPDKTERLLRRYPQPLEEISAPEVAGRFVEPFEAALTRPSGAVDSPSRTRQVIELTNGVLEIAGSSRPGGGGVRGARRPQLQAEEAAVRVDAFSLLNILEVAEAAGCSVEKAAEVYFALSERLHVDMLLTRISAFDRSDRWNALARSALCFDLYNVLARVTRAVVSPGAAGGVDTAAAAIDQWETASAEGLARVEATVTDVTQTGMWNLASLSVALRAMRTLGDSTGSEVGRPSSLC